MEIEERIRAREIEIRSIKKSMNQVEDEVFADFCVQIGVPNIRVYEERELSRQQEIMKKRFVTFFLVVTSTDPAKWII